MSNEELANLTIAMADSGDKFNLSPVNGIIVDKHSTGGVVKQRIIFKVIK